MISAALKQWLKQFAIVVKLRNLLLFIWERRTPRRVGDWRIIDHLPTFRPDSAGSSEVLAPLTVQSAEGTFPALVELLRVLGRPPIATVDIQSFCRTEEEREAAAQLKGLLDHYGSDKANNHNYHLLYGPILSAPETIESILEVGLGTNNTDTPSHMGSIGRPGASLRAFCDYLPRAQIFGADVDRRILFQEGRISTFFVDQMDLTTVEALSALLPNEMDLIIDDGLHSPAANIAILLLAVPKLKIGGWVIIEDIPSASIPVWRVISSLMPASFECSIVAAAGGNLFVARRAS